MRIPGRSGRAGVGNRRLASGGSSILDNRFLLKNAGLEGQPPRRGDLGFARTISIGAGADLDLFLLSL
jgi:hypothetical protein